MARFWLFVMHLFAKAPEDTIRWRIYVFAIERALGCVGEMETQ